MTIDAAINDAIDAYLTRALIEDHDFAPHQALAMDFREHVDNSAMGPAELTCAQTGTFYVEVPGNGTVRFADHADVYGTSAYTVDGCEGTYAGALALLKTWIEEEGET